MIWTVVKLNVRRLLHNRSELLLTFVVPIAFFSVFALIFGKGIGAESTSRIKVVVVDEAKSRASASVVRDLRDNAGLRLMPIPNADDLDRESAKQIVRKGAVSMAVIIRADENDPDDVRAELLADASDQIASQVASALVTRSIMLVQAEIQQEQFGFLADSTAGKTANDSSQSKTPFRVASARTVRSIQPGPNEPGNYSDVELSQSSSISDLPDTSASIADPVAVTDVMGEGKSNPVVSMYAAGIAVMFLLFGASGGGGALLEECENRTLDRLLSTRMTMDHLLVGKWFYMTLVGIVQVSAMFGWAQVVFGVDVLGHIDGFIVMTFVTAAAASAFGLLLATLCRTRGQLNGLSVILILTMSALGGSMVPRYVMSESMRSYGKWTFNSWALDGYDKVFWRDLPAHELMPQFIVLSLAGAAFLVAARMLAYRWEFN